MTPEEAAYHAKMLQKNLREKREQQEKQDELERERNRIKSNKQMQDT